MADIDSNSTNVSLTVAGSELILFDSDGNDVRVPIADISAQYTPGAGIAISTANVISVDGGSIAAGSIPGLAVVPNFGAQDIITTGNITAQDATFNGDVNVTGTHTPVPDYVFQKYFTGTSSLNEGYTFKTLSEIEKFVRKNNHLPGIQSAQEIKAQGFWNLGEASRINLEKIEELFLHTIEQEKKIESLQKENTQLAKELEALKSQVETIQKMLAKDNE
ncbi:bZIP transcription factor [Maribacter litopenaei]|uniref:BZIP transcription factor n=1 Tax=Maribacter litopenaei TaxID=2976127 RepID=A0ABY5Y541_9FLAO|nr:bZIP transcription factor [Maribacter litopenaei]UWX54147.1 bZIP transcription factor [Maribacter litopenaei]